MLVLVSDCLAIYDDVNPHQQKCCSHHFRALDRAVERHPRQASPWLDSVRLLLRTAMILAPLRAASEPVAWSLVLVGLERRAAELLSAARLEPAEESVRRRLSNRSSQRDCASSVAAGSNRVAGGRAAARLGQWPLHVANFRRWREEPHRKFSAKTNRGGAAVDS